MKKAMPSSYLSLITLASLSILARGQTEETSSQSFRGNPHENGALEVFEGERARILQEAACGTGTGAELTGPGGFCEGGVCCTGVNACVFTGVSTICEGSCDGSHSCESLVQGSFIGPNSCQGFNACNTIAQISVLEYSCQGDYACEATSNRGGTVSIGTGSCNGESSCSYLGCSVISLSVGDSSCTSESACENIAYSIFQTGGSLTIGSQTCQGRTACMSAFKEAGNVAVELEDNVCNGISACKQLSEENLASAPISLPSGFCNGNHICEECCHPSSPISLEGPILLTTADTTDCDQSSLTPAAQCRALQESDETYLEPTSSPTTEISLMPSQDISLMPSIDISLMPSIDISLMPSQDISLMPSQDISLMPSIDISLMPSQDISLMPSIDISLMPSIDISLMPSQDISLMPSQDISLMPSIDISLMPSIDISLMPSIDISLMPSIDISLMPSQDISLMPSIDISLMPSQDISLMPSIDISLMPSIDISLMPSQDISLMPSIDISLMPSQDISLMPSQDISLMPSIDISLMPSIDISLMPSIDISLMPSIDISLMPSQDISLMPSQDISLMPSQAISTTEPTLGPTSIPTTGPTSSPTSVPTTGPTLGPTSAPTQDTRERSTPVVNGLQPDCNTIDTTKYNVCLDLQVSQDDRLEAFRIARDLWTSVITGHVGVFPFGSFVEMQEQGTFWATDVPDDIDDMYIAGFEVPIDGPGSVLGSAGPVYIFENGLPATGRMKFDSEDVALRFQSDPNFFLDVVIHEMGHVFGIGTLWERNGLLIRDDGTGAPVYLGARAQQEWEALGCTDPIPIETDGGGGTAFGHWDEVCLGAELMTGFKSSDTTPLSSITIGGLEDLGYTVDFGIAQPYSLSDIDTSFCCFPDSGRRNLRRARQDRSLEEMSEETMMVAKRYAARELSHSRNGAPLRVPEGMRYVGGEILEVLVLDEDNQIRDVTLTWDDVKELMEPPPPACAKDLVANVLEERGTKYETTPLLITGQNATTATLRIVPPFADVQEFVYVEYMDDFQKKCVGFENYEGIYEATITAQCMSHNPVTIVNVYVAGESIAKNNSGVPQCCHPPDAEVPPAVARYSFEVYCVTRCASGEFFEEVN